MPGCPAAAVASGGDTPDVPLRGTTRGSPRHAGDVGVGVRVRDGVGVPEALPVALAVPVRVSLPVVLALPEPVALPVALHDGVPVGLPVPV